jgi:archaellum component FlaC
MAARKSTPHRRAPRPPSRQAFTVVLEDLRSQFKVFGEALSGVDARVRSMDARLGAVENRLGAVENRLGAVENRLGNVENRLGNVENRLGNVENDMGLVKAALVEHGRDLREVKSAVARIDERLDRKVDREEVEAIVLRIVAAR